MVRSRGLPLVSAALFVAGASACGEVESKGQLILTLQTDMALPKDVDTVRIQISSFGNVQHENDYAVGPQGARIPATLALVGGEDPSRPVTIRISALQRNRIRTLREIVTTVPEHRLATLRVPIQWLCDDAVTETADGLKHTCTDEETCVAGRCVPKDLDSSTLPDYRPEDVFGGAREPGPAGACLDTVACFAQGFSAGVDRDTCTLELPEGGDGVNVALVTPKGGDGICGRDVCLVPLDARSEAGWQEQDGRIALPEAACARLDSGRALAVAVTTACESKTDRIPTCGPWSSVEGQPGTFDGAAPEGVDLGEGGDRDIASLEIGPEGGTLTSLDGILTVTVPAGAVDEPFTLTIAPATEVPEGNLGPAYDVGPDGMAFQEDVEILYRYGEVALGGASPASLRVATVGRGESAGWAPLDGSALNEDAQEVTGLTSGFSLFGLVSASDPACLGEVIEAEPLPAALYLMVDASEAMTATGSGEPVWDDVAEAIRSFASDPGMPNTRLALQVFQGLEAMDETTCEGGALTFPGVAMSLLPEGARAVDQFLDGVFPDGSSPIEPALHGLVGFLTSYSEASPDEVPAGILVSGSPPDACTIAPHSALASIVADGLMPEALSGPVPALFTLGVGDADLELLHQLSEASASWLPEDERGSNSDAIADSLRSMRRRLTRCAYALPPGSFDAAEITLRTAGSADEDGGGAVIPQVAGPGGCGDAGEGWFLNDEDLPARVELCSASCGALGGVEGGPAARLEYVLGCPASGGGDGTPRDTQGSPEDDPVPSEPDDGDDCLPRSCRAEDCGPVPDGCGGTLDCGECEEECIPDVCGPEDCGPIPDGCGDVMFCEDGCAS